MADRMTNVKALAYVLENCEIPEDVAEKLNGIKTSLEKRASHKQEGPTKVQKENLVLAEKVLAAMEPEVEYGNSEIADLIPELDGATPQKVSPLMKLLGDRIVTTKVKGKAIYKVA